jgi:hypothetical protein
MLKMMGFRWSVLLMAADPTLLTVTDFSPQCERDSAEQKQERDSMIPFDAFIEIDHANTTKTQNVITTWMIFN